MSIVAEKIRKFNRFYMPTMNLLGDHYLGSEYSITEVRVIFELYNHDGSTASQIAYKMNIDKSYLSRIIHTYEKKKYLIRERSAKDARAYHLHLTELGQNLAQEYINKSNNEINQIVGQLSAEDQKKLIDALDTVVEILSKGETEL